MSAMAADRVFLLALLATMATVLYSTEAAAPVQASAGAPRNNNNTEFIRRSCSSTVYPSVCYASLAGYATAVAEDPTQLARVAANVSLARVSSVSFHVSSLCRAGAARKLDPRTASALGDCKDSLGDAADLSRQAAAELALLATAEGPEVAWRVSNAQTWLSAVLTNEETCTDGFADAAPTTAVGASPPASAVKADVGRRVWRAKQYTSNALALVNSLVGTNR